MLALVTLVVAVPLARFVSSLRTVLMVQLALFLLAGAVLVATAPDYGSSSTTGFLLALVLAPVTALAIVIGRAWRARSTHQIEALG